MTKDLKQEIVVENLKVYLSEYIKFYKLHPNLIDNTVSLLTCLVTELPDLPAPKLDIDSKEDIGLIWDRNNHLIEIDVNILGDVFVFYYGKTTGSTWETKTTIQEINSKEIINQMKWLL